MSLEIERKYLGADLTLLRAKLTSARAGYLGRYFEHNRVFESEQDSLFEKSMLLRLRSILEAGKSDRHILTLKLPGQDESGGAYFKVRDEREVEVLDADRMCSVLEGLGYRVSASYEKVREIWTHGKCEICLDQLPFCFAVEVEGRPIDIETVEKTLGLDAYSMSTASYHKLHQEWRAAQGLAPKLSFVFEENEKRKLLKELGL